MFRPAEAHQHVVDVAIVDQFDRACRLQRSIEADVGDAAAIAELIDAFSGRLEFGTAGLRGALAAEAEAERLGL